MNMGKRVNKKEAKKALLEALERSLGVVTPACKEVGISRNTFYVYYNSDDKFKKEVDDLKEVKVDFGESLLLRKMREGDTRAIIFFMKYMGKKRGYTNSMDLTSGGNPITINYVNPDGDEDENEDDEDDIENEI